MPKGKVNPRHIGAFKQRVIEEMRQHGMGYHEAMRKHDITGKDTMQRWERIYLEKARKDYM